MPPYSLAIWCCRLHNTCQLCGESITTQSGRAPFACGLLCGYCHEQLPALPTLKLTDDLPLCVGAFYDMPLKRVMARYKDKQDLSALLVLYHVLCQMQSDVPADSVIVPVPTTKRRLTKRGFNPVLTLAKFLSYWWQMPIWQGIARVENELHQRGLDKQARLSNVKDDFYVLGEPPARSLILFDDVVTTGATLSAMAQTIWRVHPKTKITAVGVLHGKPSLHLPVFDRFV